MNKYTMILIVLVGLSSTIIAQDSPKHEIGIRLLDLRDFNVIYKKNTSEQTYFRLRSSFTRFTSSADFSNVGLGSFIGLEKRKPIAGKAEFIYGGEVGVFYSYSEFDAGNASNFNFSFGGVVGIQHRLSDVFNLGLELVPTFSINTSSVTPANYNFDASFSTAAIFVTYKFGKTSG